MARIKGWKKRGFDGSKDVMYVRTKTSMRKNKSYVFAPRVESVLVFKYADEVKNVPSRYGVQFSSPDGGRRLHFDTRADAEQAAISFVRSHPNG